MFSVPYNYTIYQNRVAVGSYDKAKETDESLYKEMYKNEEMTNFSQRKADGCNVTFEGKSLDIMCTMSP